MRYWLFHGNQVNGPYDREQIAQLGGFSSDSLVCPEGKRGTEMGDWVRAGVVPELAETLLRGAAPQPARSLPGSGSGGLLPPEPTLRDLATMGTMQEKIALLETALLQLQGDARNRDQEISQLKVGMAAKEDAVKALEPKLMELESRLAASSKLHEELDKALRLVETQEKRIDGLQRELDKAREAAAKRSPEIPAVREPERPLPQSPVPAIEPPRPKASPRPQDALSDLVDLGAVASEAPRVQTPTPIPAAASRTVRSIAEIPEAEERPAELQKTRSKAPLLLAALVVLAACALGVVWWGGSPGLKLKLAAKQAPAPAPAVPQAPQADPSKQAEDFARAYPLSGGATLGARLETAHPSTGQLQPWMVEKMEEDKYLARFYVRGTPLVYEFEVHPRAGSLQGLNPSAAAVLRGEMPRSPAAPEPVALPPRSSRRLQGTGRKGRPSRARRAAMEKQENLLKDKDAQVSVAKPGSGGESDEDVSLDQLLLPGVPRPGKSARPAQQQ